MPKVEFDIETSLGPDRVVAALTDFSDRRPEIWSGIEPSLYQVYSVGETSADIKEGTKTPGMSVWAKEHYDWSTPGTVTWTVQESNFSTPGSNVSATVTPGRVGGSVVHVVWNRTGSTFKGRLIVALIKMSNGKPLAASFKRAFDKVQLSGGSPS